MRNFYAIDTETNGFKYNEPLQVSVILYQDGKETESFNQFYRSEHPCTKKALEIHQLTKKKLREKRATPFTRMRAKELLMFLNKHEQLPIVAFHAGYDRNKVLKPAYWRLSNNEMDALDDRWICAQERCKRTGNWKLWNLDEALEHFGFKRRPDDAYHDAIQDARLAAKVYMMAIKLTPLKEEKHGFVDKNEEDEGCQGK